MVKIRCSNWNFCPVTTQPPNSSTRKTREGRGHRGLPGESGSTTTDHDGSGRYSNERDSVKADVKNFKAIYPRSNLYRGTATIRVKNSHKTGITISNT